jgi:two-component sensor histidine kinase
MSAEDGSGETRLRAMTQGLRDRHIAVLHQGADTLYDFAENLPQAWPNSDVLGRTDTEVLPAELAAVLAAARTEAEHSGETHLVEAELPGENGVRRLFEIQVTSDIDAAGIRAGFILVIADITEARARELALASLMREVSHRSKNLLAIVQAIAAQTASHTDTVGDFLAKFRGRLRALAGAQDLMTESDWRGTRFRELAAAQLYRLGQPILDATSLGGDNPVLGPNAALHIGLAIHELAANALLHGAPVAEQRGAIRLTASLLPPPENMLVLEWREQRRSQHGANVPRFGTVVLERIVPLAVHGTATYEITADAVNYRLQAPIDQLAL